MKIRKRLAALPLTALVTLAPNVPAQSLGGLETEQNQQQRLEAQQREAAVSAPAVRSTVPKIEAYPDLPHESPCFRIDRFTLDVPETLPPGTRTKGASALPLDPFAFAREWLDHYEGQSPKGTSSGACVGKEGINVLTKGLQQAILSRGYVTTRVLVQPQDLSTGTLAFALVPGIVRQVRFADPTLWGTWKTAFPTSSGDVLNLRDLEQGLEQMKRVASQDVDMKIEPTEIPGESDVVLNIKRSKPWTFVASVDNSGTDATGKWQGNISLGLNNPLGLNDILSLGANQDLSFGNKALGSHGFNGSYSVPWGYWTATLSGYTNTYYQNIAGVNRTFVSSGNTQTAALRIARVISRSQNDVLGGYVQLSKRFGESFIDDTTIPTQARNNTFLELGATDRHYFGAAQFDGTLAYRQGIGGFGATADPYPDGPTYRYHMAVLDANLAVPFAIAGQGFRYVGTVHGQFTNDTLFYVDGLTIGSRYTVRGFDGETMLAAERGFYWRNELQWPVFQTGQTLYAGIDYGRVFGPNTAALVGTQLAGAVIGIRGGVPTKYVGVSYDLFAGTPIYKPEGYPTARWTVGFQMTAAF
ncbi:ShlB/FhaC/HecB family hemolysin secretion/activation protein [Paraburkholderia tagetis]|uniref:ShlB/FhaC/HecB family hemolysin secretion/activation protein n=1 Tax=Paraburkholderia tagetis TaxID=2913261 RepID=A0A9X1UIG9_9BURK|nr:ShlB/FhaC/HecB family hemolysin secretion/activation protein [Paraburkholderia tagetis]MCG5075173.1 ShlB/FhaC/HecB family hemolysin secretion/activation protein [Paraburkholderia tagetis]